MENINLNMVDTNKIENEFERILNSYDNGTLVMLLSENTNIEFKKKYIKEFHEN